MPGKQGSGYETKVFTAALAIIEIGGIAVGKIRNLQFTENIQRADVQGLGRLTLSEVPPVSIRCSFTADSYMVDFNKLGDVEDPFWPTKAKTAKEFADTLLLGEKGVNLHVYSKIPAAGATDENGIITATENYKMGVAANCFLDSRVFNVQENQVAGKNLTGRYLEPISAT